MADPISSLPLAAPMKHNLNKEERHTLIIAIGNFLLSKSKPEIDAMFENHEKVLQTSQSLMATAWKALKEAHPSLQSQQHLLAGGEIRNEIFRQLGEFTRCKGHFPLPQRTSEDFLDMCTYIENAYRRTKTSLGKRKAIGQPSALPFAAPPIQGTRSFQGAAMDGSPVLFIVKRERIIFDTIAPRLGEGAFGFVSKCRVQDPNFPDPVYACKTVTLREVGVPKNHAASMEATAIHCIHRGIVNAMGLCRDDQDPLILFKYWNGGNLNSWIWRCKADGRTPPPYGLTGLSIPATYMPRFRTHIFEIINSILQTMEYLHSNDLLHNDLSTRNIFIHFSEQSERVFAGIGDWGRSTAAITLLHAVPLAGDSLQQRTTAKERWPWMAPECLRQNPRSWSRRTDVYSLGYVIQEIVKLIDIPVTSVKRSFVQHIKAFCSRAMEYAPESRPTAYEFAMCMAKAQSYGLDVSRNSGLRPFDE